MSYKTILCKLTLIRQANMTRLLKINVSKLGRPSQSTWKSHCDTSSSQRTVSYI